MIKSEEKKTIKGKDSHYSPEEIIIKLKKLIKMMEQLRSDWGNEITHAQARIIFPIVRDGKGYTMQELTNIVGVTKGLISRTITDLESKGFVKRDKKTENQDRNYNIILSVKGQKILTKKMMKLKKVSTKLKRKITHEDMITFHKVLDALIETPNEVDLYKEGFK